MTNHACALILHPVVTFASLPRPTLPVRLLGSGGGGGNDSIQQANKAYRPQSPMAAVGWTVPATVTARQIVFTIPGAAMAYAPVSNSAIAVDTAVGSGARERVDAGQLDSFSPPATFRMRSSAPVGVMSSSVLTECTCMERTDMECKMESVGCAMGPTTGTIVGAALGGTRGARCEGGLWDKAPNCSISEQGLGAEVGGWDDVGDWSEL